MHGLEAEYGDRINFVYLDVDDSRTNSFKKMLGYQYQPHFFLLDSDGNTIAQWVGSITWETLESAFLDALSSSS